MIFIIGLVIAVALIILVMMRKEKMMPQEVVDDVRIPYRTKVPPLPTPMMNFDLCNQWGTNPGYTQCYPFTTWDQNECDMYANMDIDEKNSMHWKRSNRDKKLLDGWASKNADYYKKNFYNELEKEEAKVWWGNNEN